VVLWVVVGGIPVLVHAPVPVVPAHVQAVDVNFLITDFLQVPDVEKFVQSKSRDR
jgi:hypothetical protein